jgi:DNA-binding SARP family transcriptional activator
MSVTIRLFGVPAVLVDGRRVDAFRSQQARRLFCYLALSFNRAQAREMVAEALWGERPTGDSIRTLRSELYRLRKSFGASDFDCDVFLHVGSNAIQINTTGDCHLDIEDFQRLGMSAAAQPVELLSEDQIAGLRQAAALYLGPLMSDSYEDWCISERQRLQEMYLEILAKLLLVEARKGNLHEAIEYGYRVLREEPLMESVHRQIMRLHYLSGNRAAAMRQFETCRRLLTEELGIEPMRRTRRIYEMILADRLELSDRTAEPEDMLATDEVKREPAAGTDGPAANARMAATQLQAATQLLMDTARYLNRLGEQLDHTVPLPPSTD